MRVDATSYDDAVRRIIGWSQEPASRYVCVADAHMVIEGADSRTFQKTVNEADLVTPDGMPLVWSLRLLGIPAATRVYGPNLMRELLRAAEQEQVPVAFYGGTPQVLASLIGYCGKHFPRLNMAYHYAPPFRPLTPEEDIEVTARLNASGARIVFVGIGCPKQEAWMAAHKGSLSAVMVGVGAAFDFLTGVKPQAPVWMQRFGLEWSYRLATEPRRLWRRYMKTVPRFAFLMTYRILFGHDLAGAGL